jgi:hypothetical protein
MFLSWHSRGSSTRRPSPCSLPPYKRPFAAAIARPSATERWVDKRASKILTGYVGVGFITEGLLFPLKSRLGGPRRRAHLRRLGL